MGVLSLKKVRRLVLRFFEVLIVASLASDLKEGAIVA